MTGARHRVTRLGEADAGEVLTLQRAAFVGEARLYDDPHIPPLTQSLDELVRELGRPDVVALGVREHGRLVGACRLRVDGRVAHLGRLGVAPDRQGEGVGAALLAAVDGALPPEVGTVTLFTGDRSEGNLRLYRRAGFEEERREPVGGMSFVHFVRARRR